MRTTLKRGLGRAAAPDGNGKPVLPPGALSPVNVYRQPPRGPRSRIALVGQIALWLGAASLVLLVGAAGGAYLYFHESVAAVAAKTPEVRRAARKLDVPLPGHPAVALVIGYDHRLADGKGAPSRSDTLMLVRADPVTDSISLLSFPRDMRVPIAYGLSWPERIDSGVAPLDFATLAAMSFEIPDAARFPGLQLAWDAMRGPSGTTAVLNAANEIAVQAFLDRRIRFDRIYAVNLATLEDSPVSGTPACHEDLMAIDRDARSVATAAVDRMERA